MELDVLDASTFALTKAEPELGGEQTAAALVENLVYISLLQNCLNWHLNASSQPFSHALPGCSQPENLISHAVF